MRQIIAFPSTVSFLPVAVDCLEGAALRGTLDRTKVPKQEVSASVSNLMHSASSCMPELGTRAAAAALQLAPSLQHSGWATFPADLEAELD